MFQFGRFPTYYYVFIIRSVILHHGGFPIRISAGLCLFAAHRSFSQLVTSFFGSWCQGIPLMLFLAWTLLYISFSVYTCCSLYCLNCCVSRLQLLNFFRSGKIVSFTLSERPDFFKSRLFPLLLFKPVRVLKFFLFGFQWASPAFRLRSFLTAFAVLTSLKLP